MSKADQSFLIGFRGYLRQKNKMAQFERNGV